MAESSGVNPVPLPLARYLPAAPARAADCKLFADSLAGADRGLAQVLSEALMPRAPGQGHGQCNLCCIWHIAGGSVSAPVMNIMAG